MGAAGLATEDRRTDHLASRGQDGGQPAPTRPQPMITTRMRQVPAGVLSGSGTMNR